MADVARNSDFSEEDVSLSKLFDETWNAFSSLENSDEPSNSKNFQKNVEDVTARFEKATRLVSSLGLFSSNENFEEIQTNDIKYLLLPAILGDLSQKRLSENRLELLNISEVYYKDFLTWCENYQIISGDNESTLSVTENRVPPTLTSNCLSREAKIQRYKEQKRLEEKLSQLKKKLDTATVDEDVKRSYYTMLLKKWTYHAIEELQSIEMEKSILMLRDKEKNKDTSSEEQPVRKPLKPVIITRDAIQKKIYGLGYPSIPTMSIEEFYEQKLKKNNPQIEDTSSLMARAMAGVNCAADKDADEINKEIAEETDDPSALKHARDFDDWKDVNPRGSGNRKNKG